MKKLLQLSCLALIGGSVFLAERHLYLINTPASPMPAAANQMTVASAPNPVAAALFDPKVLTQDLPIFPPVPASSPPVVAQSPAVPPVNPSESREAEPIVLDSTEAELTGVVGAQPSRVYIPPRSDFARISSLHGTDNWSGGPKLPGSISWSTPNNDSASSYAPLGSAMFRMGNMLGTDNWSGASKVPASGSWSGPATSSLSSGQSH